MNVVLGTLAGDDTAVVIMRDTNAAAAFCGGDQEPDTNGLRGGITVLSLLHIENIAVIESADISFDGGFTVLDRRDRRGQIHCH